MLLWCREELVSQAGSRGCRDGCGACVACGASAFVLALGVEVAGLAAVLVTAAA